MSEETKVKSHVSYPKELRSEASMNLKGLITVHVKFPDGTSMEHQQEADMDECQFAKWGAALLARKDVRPLPLLEEVVRQVCKEKGITS